MRIKKFIYILILTLGLNQVSLGQIALENVSVISMEDSLVLQNQLVLINNGLIEVIEPSNNIEIPAKYEKIDASGKYLMPGLYDMHMHYLSDDRIDEKYMDHEVAISLSYGVLTNRLMIGRPEHLRLKKRIASGEIVGPRVYVASPQLSAISFSKVFNGLVIKDFTQGYEAVKLYSDKGYDFIKLTFGLNNESYQGIIKAANEEGIPVVGHVSRKIKLRTSIKSGQDIEHLDQYMDAIISNEAPTDEGLSAFGIFKEDPWYTLNFIDSAKLEEVIQLTVKHDIWNTPTNFLFISSFAHKRSDSELEKSPEWSLLSTEVKKELLKYRKKYWDKPPAEDLRIKYEKTRAYIIKEIFKRSGKIMAGSDAPEWLTLYGSGLHRELKNFVYSVGLSPYEALQTATVKPAEYLNENKSGMVKMGYNANLVLLKDNPLENIEAIENIEGIVLNGNWISKTKLQVILNNSQQALNSAPLRSNEK